MKDKDGEYFVVSKKPCPKCGYFGIEMKPVFTQDADSTPLPHCGKCGFLRVEK